MLKPHHATISWWAGLLIHTSVLSVCDCRLASKTPPWLQPASLFSLLLHIGVMAMIPYRRQSGLWLAVGLSWGHTWLDALQTWKNVHCLPVRVSSTHTRWWHVDTAQNSVIWPCQTWVYSKDKYEGTGCKHVNLYSMCKDELVLLKGEHDRRSKKLNPKSKSVQ